MNILFAGHDFKFLRALVARYQQDADWTVLEDTYSGHVIKDTARSATLLEDADVIFCEWALGNLEWYSHHKRPAQRLIVRLHAQEATLPYLDRANRDAVDALIFICQHKMDAVLARFPDLRDRSHLIYNSIDAEELLLPKVGDYAHTLGLMGTAPMGKAPHVALEILQQLRQHDSRFTLTIKGRHPWEYDWLWRRPDERAYYEELYARFEDLGPGAVTFDAHGDDVAAWFQRCGFLLSTSDHEGSHQAVAEGMAAGCVPVIRNWHGADTLYPVGHIFGSADQATQRVADLAQSSAAVTAAASEAAEFAHERFDVAVVLPRIGDLIGEAA